MLLDQHGMEHRVLVFNLELAHLDIIKSEALVLAHLELNVQVDLAGMEDTVSAQLMLFAQVDTTLMELNVQFKPQQPAQLDSNSLEPTALLKQILLVLMEDFGMDQLVLFKLKEYAQVDIHLMLEFAPRILPVLAHMDIILLEHLVSLKQVCLAQMEEFGMDKTVLLLLKELALQVITLMDLNVSEVHQPHALQVIYYKVLTVYPVNQLLAPMDSYSMEINVFNKLSKFALMDIDTMV